LYTIAYISLCGGYGTMTKLTFQKVSLHLLKKTKKLVYTWNTFPWSHYFDWPIHCL